MGSPEKPEDVASQVPFRSPPFALTEGPLRCYITGRKGPGGLRLAEAIAAGVELIQIREKDLSARELLVLVRQAVQLAAGTCTRILVNDRADVAHAAGAAGVHLPSDAPPAHLFRPYCPLIGVSCHTLEDVRRANEEGVDFLVFGPVWVTPGKGTAVGLSALRQAAAQSSVPILALGGVTPERIPECLEAGAAGYAAIRMFQSPFARQQGEAFEL